MQAGCPDRTPASDFGDTFDCGLSAEQFADGLAFLASVELPTWAQASGWREQAGLGGV